MMMEIKRDSNVCMHVYLFVSKYVCVSMSVRVCACVCVCDLTHTVHTSLIVILHKGNSVYVAVNHKLSIFIITDNIKNINNFH